MIFISSDSPSVDKNSVMFTVDSQTDLDTYEVTGRWPVLQVLISEYKIAYLRAPVEQEKRTLVNCNFCSAYPAPTQPHPAKPQSGRDKVAINTVDSYYYYYRP